MPEPKMAVKGVPPAGGHLMRILGLSFGIAVIFGGTVGVGILRLPGEIAGQLGSTQLILTVWVVGGVYSLLGAISISEVGAALPQAGGFYVYSRRAFGPAAGFAVGWGDWLINCSSIAYAVVAAAEYLMALFPGLAPQSGVMQTCIALGLLALFCGLHWFGLRLGSGVQKLTSVATGLTFVALAVACLLHTRPEAHAATAAASTGRPGGLVGMLVPIIAVLPAIVVAYDGWYEAIYFTEEDTNAAKHLPQAMIGCVVLITCLYLLMNLSFLHVNAVIRSLTDFMKNCEFAMQETIRIQAQNSKNLDINLFRFLDARPGENETLAEVGLFHIIHRFVNRGIFAAILLATNVGAIYITYRSSAIWNAGLCCLVCLISTLFLLCNEIQDFPLFLSAVNKTLQRPRDDSSRPEFLPTLQETFRLLRQKRLSPVRPGEPNPAPENPAPQDRSAAVATSAKPDA